MPENKFLTPDIIARESLMILQSNTVMAGLVYRDYEEEFGPSKVGDTITIRKPATFEAKEFSGHTEVQDAKEGRVSLTLEKHLDVTTAVTSKQWTLELDDFSARIITPAMVALNEKLDRYLCGLYPAFHQVAGVAGSGPDSLAHLAKLDEVMNEAKIPVAGRRVVVGPATKSAMFAIPEVARADARGDEGTALREASMGRIMGMDWFMDQNINRHTAGSAKRLHSRRARLDADSHGQQDTSGAQVCPQAGGHYRHLRRGRTWQNPDRATLSGRQSERVDRHHDAFGHQRDGLS